MKKLFLILFLLIFVFTTRVFAQSNNVLNDTYKEQFKMSGAEEFINELPKDAAQSLDRIGITGGSWEEFSNLTPESIFDEIINVGKDKIFFPFFSLMPVLAIILLCALVQNIKTSFGSENMAGLLTAVGTLCLCVCIINPVVRVIHAAALLIKGAASFTLCYIPVMTGIMIASGNPVSATSYHILMLAAGQVISQISGNFLVPIMNAVLGLSVVSSLSPRLSLESLCKMFHKCVKWVVEGSATVFVGVLTLQNLVTASADNITTSGMKFAISSFVPIVGGALSDAFSTVQGCVKLLKSGIGAFGIIAGGAIFLPVILECIAWILFLNICSSIGEVFELEKISSLIKSIAVVMSTLLAVVLCSMMVLIVSTVLILVIGGR